MKSTPRITPQDPSERLWKPGQSGNPAGKPKGATNKINRDIRDMIERALHKVGGADYLARQAEQNPVAFMALVARVLPLQLANADGQKLLVDFRWADQPAPTIDAVADETRTVADETNGEDVDGTTVTFIGEC